VAVNELLNNSWIVGIGGGVLSGLVVTAITRYLFSKRDNKEYLQKIEAVNREVIYALRPGISEGQIPTNDVLRSVVNATARKYKVNRTDVFRVDQIAEELIKEIMDSSFISSETKKSYCDTLAHIVRPNECDDTEPNLGVNQHAAEYDYRSRIVFLMSSILGLTTAFITVFIFGFRDFFKTLELSIGSGDPERVSRLAELKDLLEFLLPAFGMVGATLMATVTMMAVIKLRGMTKERPGKRAESLSQGSTDN
jgi:hypothetical protein